MNARDRARLKASIDHQRFHRVQNLLERLLHANQELDATTPFHPHLFAVLFELIIILLVDQPKPCVLRHFFLFPQLELVLLIIKAQGEGRVDLKGGRHFQVDEECFGIPALDTFVSNFKVVPFKLELVQSFEQKSCIDRFCVLDGIVVEFFNIF